MTRFKTIILSSAAIVTMGAGPVTAAGFTSHHAVDGKPYENYAEQLPAEQKLELRNYLDYTDREPCQNYRPAPEGFVKVGCHLEPASGMRDVVQVREPVDNLRIRNILTDYEINFAFDSAAVGSSATGTLDRIAREIEEYDPREVTVAGHADKAGPSDYNVDLSQRRAEAVSEALNDRGIENRIIDKEAYGENKPAVDTRDGVALRENRRVVVEFRK